MTMYISKGARAMQACLRDVSLSRAMTPDEEAEAGAKAQAGDAKAIEALVWCNLKFALSVAKQYCPAAMQTAWLPDFICAANIGLFKAAKRFDPSKGFKFISFAVWHIKNECGAIIPHLNGIRIPEYTSKKIGVLNADAGFDESLRVLQAAEARNISSLDACLYDSHTPHSECVESSTEPPDVACMRSDLVDILHKRIRSIKPDLHAKYVALYFGLDGVEYTITEIAKMEGADISKVRHTIEREIKKLRYAANRTASRL